MTYSALSSIGPRTAFAVSDDLFRWTRLGLAAFASYRGIDFIHVGNKDASLFPVAIANHAGKMEMGLLHRPRHHSSRDVDLDHESLWISYCPMPTNSVEIQHLGLFNLHHCLAAPVAPWGRLKVGAGTPPILTRHGWLVIYHGVSEPRSPHDSAHHLCYSAGVMVLSRQHPRDDDPAERKRIATGSS